MGHILLFYLERDFGEILSLKVIVLAELHPKLLWFWFGCVDEASLKDNLVWDFFSTRISCN